MKKEAWYDQWFVSEDYLTTALKRLDEDGVDMTNVRVLTAPEKRISDYLLVWKSNSKEEKDVHEE